MLWKILIKTTQNKEIGLKHLEALCNNLINTQPQPQHIFR